MSSFLFWFPLRFEMSLACLRVWQFFVLICTEIWNVFGSSAGMTVFCSDLHWDLKCLRVVSSYDSFLFWFALRFEMSLGCLQLWQFFVLVCTEIWNVFALSAVTTVFCSICTEIWNVFGLSAVMTVFCSDLHWDLKCLCIVCSYDSFLFWFALRFEMSLDCLQLWHLFVLICTEIWNVLRLVCTVNIRIYWNTLWFQFSRFAVLLIHSPSRQLTAQR